MQNLNAREKKLLNLTISVVAFAFILNFIIIPLKSCWDKTNEEIELKGLILEKYSDIIERGKTNKAPDFLNTKKYKTEVDAVNDIFSLVDKMSLKALVNLISIRPESKEKTDGMTSLSFEIKIEGNFKNILQFIDNISKTNSNFLVKELQISKSSQIEGLSARLVISKLVSI